MKVQQVTEGDLIGINLIAEDELDEHILERFWDGGLKANSYWKRPINSQMQVTFRDLIGK